MKITRIYPNSQYNINNHAYKKNEITPPIQANNSKCILPGYNEISFTGVRVDKGLERFFNVNKERMPITVYRYVESLVDKSRLTPLEAQQRVFANLKKANCVEDIKKLLPDEDLFKMLINPEDSRATQGILGVFRENKELLQMYNQGILSNNENLTVYLVKRIYLEGKTLDEINADLAKDIDKEFLALYKDKNPDSKKLIQASTLRALGIQTPDASYQQSLRYTREGYSDLVGENISKAQRLFWDSLSPEQRTARAKKSVEKFEKWWNNLSYKQKLEMLAEQDNKLKMLEEFKGSEKSKSPKEKANTIEDDIPKSPREERTESQHTKVGSKQLSKDELFVRWASNNLKIFEESLSESEKEAINIIRTNKMINHWNKMTPTERTEYIQKLKSGSEPLQYTMIDAWNNSRDIILELSQHLKESQVFKPHDMLYSDKEFSEFQSRIMSAFWEQHPDLAQKLGEQIKLSQEKIKKAIDNGTFNALKKEIERERSRRINEIVAIKTKELQKPTETPSPTEPPKPVGVQKPIDIKTYKDEFIEAFNLTRFGKLKFQPAKYAKEYPQALIEALPQNLIELWTKYLKGEPLSEAYLMALKLGIAIEPPQIARMNRAYEAAMADVLRRLTGNMQVYELSQSDLKTVMYHIERGESPIHIISHKNEQEYIFESIPRLKQADKKQINSLYEAFVESISQKDIDKIINDYFAISDSADPQEARMLKDKLFQYIDSYGKSIFIAFSDKSKYPINAKYRFSYKFYMGMPEELKHQSTIRPLLLTINDFTREEELNHYRYLFSKKYDFMPQTFIDLYFDRLSRGIRGNKEFNTSLLEKVCTKRESAGAGSRILTLRNSMVENKDEILAMEQALADALYEATGEEKVYTLPLEILMDKVELFKMVRSFPTSPLPCKTSTGEDLIIQARRPINTRFINKKYNAYLSEIKTWRTEINGSEPENYNEMLFILNPENGKEMIDLYTGIRMASFGLPNMSGR